MEDQDGSGRRPRYLGEDDCCTVKDILELQILEVDGDLAWKHIKDWK